MSPTLTLAQRRCRPSPSAVMSMWAVLASPLPPAKMMAWENASVPQTFPALRPGVASSSMRIILCETRQKSEGAGIIGSLEVMHAFDVDVEGCRGGGKFWRVTSAMLKSRHTHFLVHFVGITYKTFRSLSLP